MRFGNWDVKVLGGWMGCLTMILISIVLSIVLTIVINLLL
jgi:hypothetical protein